MPLVLADRVKETTTTTGTGTVTLAGAATGFQSFAAVGNANTTYYTIAGQTGSEWEVGIGTYTSVGTTLSRTTVLSSSNAGSLVVFSAGTKDVFVTYPSSRSIYADGTTLTATNSSVLPIASGGTNSTATATAGGIGYGTGTAHAYTVAGTSGQVITSAGAGVPTWTTATSANTALAIVQRDASGNFTAGTITAALTGNASSATLAANTSSISSAVGSTYTWTVAQQFQSNQNTASGTTAPLQAYATSSLGAIMAFHRAGVYAVNLGLDSDNVFRLGGWSAPANLMQITMAGALTMASSVTATSFSGAGTGLTGTASSLSIGGNAATATSATSATSATTATNVAGGVAGNVHYQTGVGTTGFVTNGTSGQVLTSNGASAPTFQTSTAASKSYAQAMRILAL
jgi:hypothetical protein